MKSICFLSVGEVEEMKINLEKMKVEVNKSEERAKAETERAEKAQADKMAVELVQWGLDEKLQVW